MVAACPGAAFSASDEALAYQRHDLPFGAIRTACGHPEQYQGPQISNRPNQGAGARIKSQSR